MDEEKNMESTAESVENVEAKEKEPVKTFTRDEVNKMISTEKQKAIEEFKAQAEAEKSEAEKLAKMKSDEKLQYQIDKSNKEKEDAVAELNAYKLKEQALNIASEKGLDISLVSFFDFKTVKAEELNQKIDEISKAFNTAVEKAVNDRLKESSPVSKAGFETVKTKEVSRSSI